MVNTLESLRGLSIKLDFISDPRLPDDRDNKFNSRIEFIEIDDNPSNIVNQGENFEDINKLLKFVFIGFQFDDIAAQNMLDEINKEINAQQEFLDM